MSTLYYAPPECLGHDPNPGHPECPERLEAIAKMVGDDPLPLCMITATPHATPDDLLLAHDAEHIDHVFRHIPSGASLNFLDDDTVVSCGSKVASLAAVGAVLAAVKAVASVTGDNAFCAIRPPGHHAHRDHAAGFCLFNNVAIGALAALRLHGLARVAILDFDVHHGDGTQHIVQDNPGVFFASTYQYPLYASTPDTQHCTGISDNVLNIPLAAGTAGAEIVSIWLDTILPKVREFSPQMIFVSAGFDGHLRDPLGGLSLIESDYAAIMQGIKTLSHDLCEGRLVVVLEGGYNLDALANSVQAVLHVMGSDT